MGNLNRSLVIITIAFCFIFCIISLYIQYDLNGVTILTYVISQEILFYEIIYFCVLILIIPIITILYSSFLKDGNRNPYNILFFKNNEYNIENRTGLISLFIILISIAIMIIFSII